MISRVGDEGLAELLVVVPKAPNSLAAEWSSIDPAVRSDQTLRRVHVSSGMIVCYDMV